MEKSSGINCIPPENFAARVVDTLAMTPRQLSDLFADHAPALALFARLKCAAAEDVVQEAFCKLAAQRVPPDDPVAWLFRVVRNGSIDAMRAERRRKERERIATANRPWFRESEIDGLDADEAVAAMKALPPEQSEVVALRIWSALNLEQIASACGCSVSSAHRRYEAGIESLRQKFGVLCPKTRSKV